MSPKGPKSGTTFEEHICYFCHFSTREQQLELEAELLAREQVQQEQKLKELQHREQKHATAEMRRFLLKQMEDRAAAEARMNLQVMGRLCSFIKVLLFNLRLSEF